MIRLRPYDVPHKALRNVLSQVSLLAGKTNYGNAAEIETLYLASKELFAMLDTHARDEENVTLAELEMRLPGSTQHDKDDHIEIHEAQHHLLDLITDIYNTSRSGIDQKEAGAEYYLALTEFHNKYLDHISQEERVTQLLLWEHFTDEELIGHRGRIMSKLEPAMLLTWFKYSAPAQSHPERVEVFSGFKKMAPEPFFNQGMGVLKEVLTSQEYNNLQTALN